MSVKNIFIDEFVTADNAHITIDVRSPSEYAHAHIPNAVNIPLFSNEERKIIGTAYKQQSRQVAIKLGLDFYGPKMKLIVEEVEAVIARGNMNNSNASPRINLHLHCWRGGMRSAAVAWLLELYGFNVYTLSGGYKAYRNWVLKTIAQPLSLKILGGFTGSGKTDLLEDMKTKGHAILNLEKLANHKGSAFGALGTQKQPSQEMFENIIAQTLYQLQREKDTSIWVEDESQRIGRLNIPQSIYDNMRQSPVYFLEIPFEKRLKNIVESYGSYTEDDLVTCISRISNRLGGLETKLAINFLFQKNVKESFRILLNYYDKWYSKGLQNRKTLQENIYKISCDKVSVTNFEKLAI